MPNNVMSRIEFNVNKSSVVETRFIETLKARLKDDKVSTPLAGLVIPMPDYIYQKSVSSEDKIANKGLDWHTWSIENYGNKWGDCDGNLEGDVFYFWTAWSPFNDSFIEKLGQIMPSFSYHFQDTSMGFAGSIVVDGGGVVDWIDCDNAFDAYPLAYHLDDNGLSDEWDLSDEDCGILESSDFVVLLEPTSWNKAGVYSSYFDVTEDASDSFEFDVSKLTKNKVLSILNKLKNDK